MNKKDLILKRQKFNTRFKNEDMDFTFNWMIGISQVIGMSPSQVFNAVNDVKDGDPKGWVKGFGSLGQFQVEHAKKFTDNNQILASGHAYLAAAYAFRASIQYCDVTSTDFAKYIQQMESSFQKGVAKLDIPVHSVEVPFEHTTLPGYFLKQNNVDGPTIMMVGGGDTFREDLFYFAGYPGWKRGYNVLMVDLPGQGKMPTRGQHFRVDMDIAITTVLDWLEENASLKNDQIAIYGVSGGGYFSAQAVVSDPRIKGWIASTPITDIAEMFRREFGNVLKAPGWMMNSAMKIAGSFSASTNISLKKYAWQFGDANFKKAVDRVLIEAKPIDIHSITCPSLFLMGEGEGEELKRQTLKLYDFLREMGVDVTLREFTAEEGADAHCQVNNLRLAHLIVFDWLDHLFERESSVLDNRTLY